MASSSNAAKDKLDISSLPWETQKQIVRYVGRRDLFVLQTVSRHFHTLASAEIYRHLDFNVISAEFEDVGGRASRAADALQTILASEYDYGQHVKSFRMGAVASSTFSFGSRHHNAYEDPLVMTRLFWDSKIDPSKFLNTALLLMARKARMLETFKWDAPIELSSAVYQALQNIPSLRHLLVRLDILPSPRIGIRHPHAPHPPPPPPGLPPSNPFPPAPTAALNSQPYLYGPESSLSKRRRPAQSKFWNKKQAFSGFQHLHTLELVGISNHECLPEVAQCVKACAAGLKSLTLTLSFDMVRKSRKAPTNAVAPALNDDLTDTELDDDDLLDPPLPPPSHAAQSANEADIREEKLAQESILAIVFDLQSVAQVGKKLEKKLSLSGGKCLEEEDTHILRDQLNGLMKSLQESPVNDSAEASTRLEQFKEVKNLVDLYLKNQRDRMKKSGSSSGSKSIDKSDKNKKLSDLIKKKGKPPSAVPSSNKASNLTNQFNGLMENFPSSLLGDETSPPFGSGSASAKSSSYGFPNTYFTGSGSSADILPPPPLPNPSNGPYSPHVASIPYSYSHSHASSGSHTPTLSSSIYQYPSNGFSASLYSPPVGMQYPNKSSLTLSKHSKSKTKKHIASKPDPPKHVSITSSDDSDAEFYGHGSKSKAAYSPNLEDEVVESMNVDMEHPDEDESDLGQDQETLPGNDETELPTPRKRFKLKAFEPTSPVKENPSESSSSGASAADRPAGGATQSATEAMQDYIRTTHGLPLEELRLHWIPLKASIVGRALDLTVLQRITLLDVGPQDTFWALLVRLTTPDNQIAFKSIHTDHVTVAFTKYLAKFTGLEELFMHERNSKSDPDSELTVDITKLRKVALTGHVSSLKRLMIRNERDDTWDVDAKMLQFLALKGHHLIELACSMKMQTYHILIQMFTAFPNLHALHLIALRSADRNLMLQLESMNFAIDGLSHCPAVKLRYLALADQVNILESRPDHFRSHLKAYKDKDKKGKGKAVERMTNGDLTDDASDRELDDMLAEVTAGEKKIRLATRFDDVKGVKIFAREIRTGRL